MRKSLVLIAALLLAVSMPVMAARTPGTAIIHYNEVYQAYPGQSMGEHVFRGLYDGTVPYEDPISSVPGVLVIDPGYNWANFVSAGVEDVPYTLKNVTMVKQTPPIVQCADRFPSHRVAQQGTPNIRLNWPLMYEIPCTTLTLTILYGTSTPLNGSYVREEQWVWHVDATLDSMQDLLELFHELPFGRDEVPIVSDEALYPVLQAKLAAIESALNMGDIVGAGLILGEFEMEVMDACIGVSPMTPAPTGPGTGIANTTENPACCTLLADAEYVGRTTGIWETKK